MGQWLVCSISNGQFSGEYAVKGELFNGSMFSLFAPQGDLHFDGQLSEGGETAGHIRVDVLEQQEGLTLVRLPRLTFENGRAITVKSTLVKTDPA